MTISASHDKTVKRTHYTDNFTSDLFHLDSRFVRNNHSTQFALECIWRIQQRCPFTAWELVHVCLCVASIVIIQGDMFYSPDHAPIHPQQNTSHDAALSLIPTTTHNGHFTKQSGEKSDSSKRLSYPLQPQIKCEDASLPSRNTRVEDQTDSMTNIRFKIKLMSCQNQVNEKVTAQLAKNYYYKKKLCVQVYCFGVWSEN